MTSRCTSKALGLLLAAAVLLVLAGPAAASSGSIPIATGTVSGDVIYDPVMDAARTRAYVEGFGTNPFLNASEWEAYPSPVSSWEWDSGGFVKSTGTFGGAGGQYDQVDNAASVANGFSWQTNLSMTFQFRVASLSTDNNAWYVGYSSWKTSPQINFCGPAMQIDARPAGSPANVSWRAVIFSDGGNNVGSTRTNGGWLYNRFSLGVWYTVNMTWTLTTKTLRIEVNGTFSTVTYGSVTPWNTCSITNGGVSGTSLVQVCPAGSNCNSVINVRHMTIRRAVAGFWASPMIATPLSAIIATYRTPDVTGAVGTPMYGICGLCYVNGSGPQATEDAVVNTSVPLAFFHRTFTFNDTTATGGAVTRSPGPWTFAMRLNNTFGIVSTDLLNVTYTYTPVPPPFDPLPESLNAFWLLLFFVVMGLIVGAAWIVRTRYL